MQFRIRRGSVNHNVSSVRSCRSKKNKLLRVKQCAFIFVLAIFCYISLRQSENHRVMEREQN